MLDYEPKEYREADLVKMDILLNGDIVDALSFIFPKEKAIARGRVICKKLKETIPKQMFEIPIQAAIGNKIVARQTLSALRKDVLAKFYGGNITRKRKLLEKQKAGKKRMRQVGSVEVPFRSAGAASRKCCARFLTEASDSASIPCIRHQ